MKRLLPLLFLLFTTSCYVYKVPELKEGEKPPTIEQEIQPQKMYNIFSQGKEYKVQAIEWDGDSLVTYEKRNPKKIKKFAKSDINGVEHRQFSRGRSDALTFGIYGLAAVIIVLLTR